MSGRVLNTALETHCNIEMANLIPVALVSSEISDLSPTPQNFLSNSQFSYSYLQTLTATSTQNPDFGIVKWHCKNPTQIPQKDTQLVFPNPELLLDKLKHGYITKNISLYHDGNYT